MADSGVDLKGYAELIRKLNRAAQTVPNEVARALYEEALVEQKESMQRTPVLTGALRSSHMTEKPQLSGRTISVKIKVGGPAAPYAVHVHENVEAFHKVGRSKFLESTIMESRPFMAARVARRINLSRLIA